MDEDRAGSTERLGGIGGRDNKFPEPCEVPSSTRATGTPGWTRVRAGDWVSSTGPQAKPPFSASRVREAMWVAPSDRPSSAVPAPALFGLMSLMTLTPGLDALADVITDKSTASPYPHAEPGSDCQGRWPYTRPRPTCP